MAREGGPKASPRGWWAIQGEKKSKKTYDIYILGCHARHKMGTIPGPCIRGQQSVVRRCLGLQVGWMGGVLVTCECGAT